MNRGVEATEIEIANARLGILDATICCSPPTIDTLSDSFVQPKGGTADPGEEVGQGDGDVRAVLMTWPTLAALQKQGLSVWEAPRSIKVGDRTPLGTKKGRTDSQPSKIRKNTLWKKIRNIASGKEAVNELDAGPGGMAVYRLERGGGSVLASRAEPETRVDRLARAIARPASAFLGEIFSMIRLLIMLPISLLLRLERCILSLTVWAICGVVQTLAEEVLTPTLALGYNYAARPTLVTAGRVADALRLALEPISLALGDALLPCATLLANCRLVNVCVERRCACHSLHHV
ncbi:unnamed protein product [Leptosia nina]|uniref:Uncharacterized protein n=1 Tax=Leptosia nina TaxID=320188 RepID=A0AAV1JV92_9NEOP